MITKINEQDFQTKVVKDAVAVVDFSATWCGPCRMLAPVLEEISEELAGKANLLRHQLRAHRADPEERQSGGSFPGLPSRSGDEEVD